MKTFPFCEIELTEGDTLTITTPELGTLEVPCTLMPFSSNNCTALDLGWIQTPQPCRANNEGNAKLMLYTNNQHYNTLQVAYHCSCPYEAHNRHLKWFNVVIDGRSASADTLGQLEKDHNHTIVEAYSHLRPAPVEPVVKPLHQLPLEQTTTVTPLPVAKSKPTEPDPRTNGYGQFQLF